VGGRVFLAGALVLSGTAVALAGSAPRSRTVQIGDAVLKPGTATVVVGGSVTWLDSGKKAHRVTSDTRAFPAFSLAPGKRHMVRFKRTGRYRYHVDGKRKGLVVVVAAETAGAASWSGSIESHGVVVGAQTCSASWKGTLRFTVSGGKLDGSGEAALSDTPTCSEKLGTPPIDHVTFTTDGTETTGPAGTTEQLLMHPTKVEPIPGYDEGGFLLHFGNKGEGLPLTLPVTGNRIDVQLKKTVPLSNSTATLADHFVLTRVK
jgi:plastocyanin